MFNCFPILYEDELFYSIASRYKRMCGISSKKALFKDFCNVEERQILMYLPVHIRSLIRNLPYTSKITEEYIINKHTLFPYLTSFISKERANIVYNEMINGTRKNPLVKAGVNSSKVKFDNNLKYCMYCYEEDLEGLRESYWRRLFQVPGVLYCPKHKAKLIESNVPTNANATEYICSDEIILESNSKENTVNNQKLFNLNIKYIESVQYLLKNDIQRKDNKFIINFYIDKLRERKLASQSGVIYMVDLLKEFKNYYSEEYLTIMQSNYDIDNKSNWLRLFVRKENKSRSVLRHLLMLNFLDVSLEKFFNQEITQGKITTVSKEKSKLRLSLEEKKEQWLKIIRDNPNTSRRKLKDIGKGIYTYVYTHDKDWYNEVTPIYKNRTNKQNVADWEERDRECLEMIKEAIGNILEKPGKPIRITKNYLKRECGLPSYFKSDKLIKTKKYLNFAIEDIDTYRRRKILWAIKEMQEQGINITVYKVHKYAGFGEFKHESIRLMIEDIIDAS